MKSDIPSQPGLNPTVAPPPRRGRALGILLAAAIGACGALGTLSVRASDHDDGTTDAKTPNVNLTDLYVFTEKSQNVSVTSDDSLIFVMNLNPRSLPGTQYHFSTAARYDFNITRVGDSTKNDAKVTGKPDVIVRFAFGDPIVNEATQKLTMSVIKEVSTTAVTDTKDKTTDGKDILTTPFRTAETPTNNAVSIGGQEVTVFAGLREDPFFFDVNAFFNLRSDFANNKPSKRLFKPIGVDFTAGLNVLSIVARIPRPLLQEAVAPKSTTFDVWETISVKQ